MGTKHEELVEKLAKDGVRITASVLMEDHGFSRNIASITLRRLVEAGVLFRHSRGNGSYYNLDPVGNTNANRSKGGPLSEILKSDLPEKTLNLMGYTRLTPADGRFIQGQMSPYFDDESDD